jgi:hypothetical protein
VSRIITYIHIIKQTALENLQSAFSVAEKKLDIPHLLDAEDMMVAGEDAIMTLITEFYHIYNKRDAPFKLSVNTQKIAKLKNDSHHPKIWLVSLENLQTISP